MISFNSNHTLLYIIYIIIYFFIYNYNNFLNEEIVLEKCNHLPKTI